MHNRFYKQTTLHITSSLSPTCFGKLLHAAQNLKNTHIALIVVVVVLVVVLVVVSVVAVVVGSFSSCRSFSFSSG